MWRALSTSARRNQSVARYPGRQRLPEAIFVESGDALFLVDPSSGLTVDCNPRAALLFEADDPAVLLGLDLQALGYNPGTGTEHRYQTLRGNTFWGRLAVRHVHLDGQAHDLIQISDISEQKRAEALLHSVALSIPGALIRYRLYRDGRDEMHYLNPGCQGLWEVDAATVEKDPDILWRMVLPEDLPAMRASVQASAEHLHRWYHEWRITTPSGKQKCLQGMGEATRLEDGSVAWSTVILDVTEHKQVVAALRDSEARYRLLAENMGDLVCLHDLDGRYRYLSPSCQQLLGYSPEELIGQDPYTLFHPEDRDRVRQEGHLPTLAGEPVRTTYRIRRKTGDYLWLESLTRPIRDEQGRVVNIQTTSREVGERVHMEAQLRHDALHDSLTGLANRILLNERLELAIRRLSREPGSRFAVLFLDLDRFKVINDSLGHHTGDGLLVAVARLLQGFVREVDLVARISGDEFVILLEHLSDQEQAVQVARRIAGAFRQPFLVNQREIHTATSIGIVLGTPDHRAASDLLRDADIAMYRAKAGDDACEVFDPAMHAEALKRVHLENDLRQALREDALVLHYQPVVSLADGLISGFEALVRWQHPRLGLLSPDTFIPLAEEIGLIGDIGLWVLRRACREMMVLAVSADIDPAPQVAVNLSARQLRDPALIDKIVGVLRETGFPAERLVLELTESMLVEDAETMLDLLTELSARAIRLSIDDFGTGYSSLAYLQRFPVNTLKIDQTFVSRIGLERNDSRLARLILGLGQELDMEVIAEGIETDFQRQQLLALGCLSGQGYLFSPPVPAGDLAGLCARDRRLG